MPDTQKPDAAVTVKMMAPAADSFLGRPWQQSPPVPANGPRDRSRPPTVQAQRAHGQLRISCHVMSFPAAFLHELVPERKFRTGRNPRSI